MTITPETLTALGITVESVFVPWSRSRHAKPNPKLNDYNLNWKVTVKRNGRKVVTTDYSAGLAHCPAYKDAIGLKSSIYNSELIIWECENGVDRAKRYSHDNRILPNPCDVLYSLVMDSDVINYSSFEEWAKNLGFDPDSRKAEATYKACMEIALKMRAGLGDNLMRELTEAFQDY